MLGSDYVFVAPSDNNPRTLLLKAGKGALQRIVVGQGVVSIEFLDGSSTIAKMTLSSGSSATREFGIAFSQGLTIAFQVGIGNSDNFTVVFD